MINGIKKISDEIRPIFEKIKKINGKLDNLGRKMILIWTVHFSLPLMIVLFSMQKHNVSFAFTGYFWMLIIGMVFGNIFLVWKYERLVTKVLFIPMFTLQGYIYFRWLQPSTFVLNSIQFIFNIIVVGIIALILLRVVLSLLWKLVKSIYLTAIMILNKRKDIRPLSSLHLRPIQFNRYSQIIIVAMVLWMVITGWSYFGFSQTYLVSDPGQEVRVGFWGMPSGDNKINNYNTTAMDEELSVYGEMNATFIFGMNAYNLDNSSLADENYWRNMTLVTKEWDKFGIQFITDLSAYGPYYDDEAEEYQLDNDFVTYYNKEYANNSMQAIMNWIELENITNFRGISMDIEEPKYLNESMPVSRDAYNEGVDYFNAMFDDFQTRFPTKEIHQIQMSYVLYDFYDGDHDLDIAHLTVSTELEFDAYGYMTYQTGSATIGYSNYRYAYTLQQGHESHGNDFVPWVGWFANPDGIWDPNVIENPDVYDHSIEQIKIAKSFGVPEIVIAPVRNFWGRDDAKGLERIEELRDIMVNGFEDFEIPITQDLKLLQHTSEWTWFPTRWMGDGDIFADLMLGTPCAWFLILNIGMVLGTGVFLVKNTHLPIFQSLKSDAMTLNDETM